MIDTDIRTILAELPCTIRSYVVACPDGTYTIVLNDRMSQDMKIKAYNHEVFHIINGDFEKKSDVNLIEIVAHRRY